MRRMLHLAFQDASSSPDIPVACRASHGVAIQAENTLDFGHHDPQFDGNHVLKLQFHVLKTSNLFLHCDMSVSKLGTPNTI